MRRRPCPVSRWSAPSDPFRRRPTVVALTLAACVVFAAATLGCSSSDRTVSAESAESAARTVSAGFGANDEVEACLVEAFGDAPQALDALSTGGDAPTEQRRALRGVLEICISPAELGGLVAAAVSGGVTTAEGAAACLRSAVEELPDERRAILLVGLALSGDGDVTQQLDVDLGSVTTELFDRCGIVAEATDSGEVTPGATVAERPSPASTP